MVTDVPSQAKIQSLLKQATFGHRPYCPRCGTSHIQRSEDRYRCKRCRRPFSLTSVSWLRGMKISHRQLWLLLQCWQQKVSFGTTMQITGVSAITVRRWFRRFRTHLVYESPSLRNFVEVDEAFLGRRRYGNQRIVLGAYERDSGAVILRAVPNREQDTTDRFLLKYVHPGSTVATDSASCYEGIDAFFGYRHDVCNHSQFHFGPTNHIESIWSALKRFIRRTYHHYHRYWLPALLREFEARINAPRTFLSPLTYLQACLAVVPSG